jgi:DNA repair exonuclease SbcCD ATPase subunit
VTVASADLQDEWRDEQPGLRFIRLVNVQAYEDATLRLSPRVNALIGPNNRGKSTFVRALRAVFYGEARDSLVRAGAKTAVVEVGVAGGRTLRFSRQARRTPVNIWSLHEADGSIVEDQGLRYETGGRAVPGWVDSLFRITKVEDLDVHIAHQKFPVFLLGESPARRSAVLSIGQEASYIRDMLTIHKERCNKDAALVRTGERELIDIAATLADLQEIDALRADLALARAKAQSLEAAAAHLHRLEDHAARMARLTGILAEARERLAVTTGLPEPAGLAALEAQLAQGRERERIAQHVGALAAALAQAQARQAVLNDLPEKAPALETAQPAQETLARLARLRRDAAAMHERLAAADHGIAALRSDLARLMDETRGRCPTCGSAVDGDALLSGHAHRAAGQEVA